MNSITSISISDLRQNAARLVKRVTLRQEPIVVMTRSKPSAVLVDVDYFSALEEAVVDITDGQEAERAKKEHKQPFASYIRKRWKENVS